MAKGYRIGNKFIWDGYPKSCPKGWKAFGDHFCDATKKEKEFYSLTILDRQDTGTGRYSVTLDSWSLPENFHSCKEFKPNSKKQLIQVVNRVTKNPKPYCKVFINKLGQKAIKNKIYDVVNRRFLK